jgi:transglutaminase-like putative cysteine protease
MRLSIQHTTVYRYTEPTRRVLQLLRVTPQSFVGQTVLDWRIDVDSDVRLRESRDGYGNTIHMLYVDRPLQLLTISVTGRVLTEDRHGLVEGMPYELPSEVFCRSTPLTSAGEALAWFAASIDEEGGSTIDKLHRLNARLYGRMRFDAEATEVETGAEEAFAAGHGVCQDFAHIFIAAARQLGIPARYVSGHLFRRDGAHMQEAAHAWAEAHVEDLGWVAFDPANGISADDAYVRVACGVDYRDAAPLAGARSGGGSEALNVEVLVRDAARGQMQVQTQS